MNYLLINKWLQVFPIRFHWAGMKTWSDLLWSPICVIYKWYGDMSIIWGILLFKRCLSGTASYGEHFAWSIHETWSSYNAMHSYGQTTRAMLSAIGYCVVDSDENIRRSLCQNSTCFTSSDEYIEDSTIKRWWMLFIWPVFGFIRKLIPSLYYKKHLNFIRSMSSVQISLYS